MTPRCTSGNSAGNSLSPICGGRYFKVKCYHICGRSFDANGITGGYVLFLSHFSFGFSVTKNPTFFERGCILAGLCLKACAV